MQTKGRPLVPPQDVQLLEGDLPADLLAHLLDVPEIALDTETTGLNPHRDRLCLVQIAAPDGLVIVLRITGKDAPNLVRLLEAERPLKVIHFARFDVGMLRHHLGARTNGVYCTKVASKIARTFTQSHGLKDLVKELAGVTLDKSQQTSYWGADDLTPAQLAYSANDVRHLLTCKTKLEAILAREGRTDLARRCMAHLETQVELDLLGYTSIFEH